MVGWILRCEIQAYEELTVYVGLSLIPLYSLVYLEVDSPVLTVTKRKLFGRHFSSQMGIQTK